MTQQEVIKAFMGSLDKTTLQGGDALNAAIKACSTFNSFDEVKTAIINDCKNAKSADDFLKTYCGIDYSTDDSGAITGLDAGGAVSLNDTDIIPESGSLKTYKSSSFTKKNLTVTLGDGKTYDDLSDSEKFIWNGLYTWWVEGALNLIEESYGENFGFGSNSSASVKTISISFVDEDNGLPSQTWRNHYIASGRTANIWLEINMHYWNSLNLTEANNSFDRTIAHEMTHAVMAANILAEPVFNSLPHFVKEGLAELTIGIKNSRKDLIRGLNAAKFENGLDVEKNTGTVESFAYEGGFVFFRYLARQAGDLTINNSSDSIVRTFRGNDSINNQRSNITIIGGKGNDAITNTGSNVLFKYAAGDGYDTITGFNATSTLQIGNGTTDTYSTVKSGNDVIVTVGKGKITLLGAASLSSVNINPSYNLISSTLTLTNSSSSKVTLASKYDVADATARTKAIRIVGNAKGNSVLGGTSNDTLYGADGDDYLVGNAGNDKLYGQEDDDTLWGGAGNDTLTGGDGDDLFIHSAGKDLIYDYATGDRISLGSAISKATLSGSNVVLTTGNGTLTVKGGKNKTLSLITSTGAELETIIGNDKVTYTDSSSAKVTLSSTYTTADATARTKAIRIVGNALDNSILGGTKNDTLYGADGDDYLVGNAGNDKLYGQNDDDTLWGGAGNDTLIGGDGDDLFIHSAGKDLIYDYAAGDRISLGSAISKATLSGSNVVLTTGNGTLTVKGGKNKTLSLITSTGKELSTIIGSDKVTYTDSSAAKVTLSSTYTTADATARTKAIRIVGNAKDNTILGGTGKDTLYGGDGDDYLEGNEGADKFYGQDGDDTLYGGAGNDSLYGGDGDDYLEGNEGADKFYGQDGDDTLYGGAGNDSLYGGDGDDYLEGNEGSDKLYGQDGDNTLVGGAGNDSLWGGDGSDMFLYDAGDGKDVIFGFDDDDMLEISDTFSAKYYASSDKIVFKVGSTASAITLKDFTADTFNINGDTYKISGSKLVKK